MHFVRYIFLFFCVGAFCLFVALKNSFVVKSNYVLQVNNGDNINFIAKKLEKEAMQQEMIENIKEHAAESQRTSADTKRAIARRERAEADSMGAEDAQRTIISESASMEDTQNAVNSEITNILNKLSLLSNDVKGSAVDSQI